MDKRAQKNNQRNIFNHADNFARILLFPNRRKKFFARSGGKYRSSSVAAGNFLHNRRVNFPVHDF